MKNREKIVLTANQRCTRIFMKFSRKIFQTCTFEIHKKNRIFEVRHFRFLVYFTKNCK